MKSRLLLSFALSLSCLTAQAQDVDGWKTVLAAKDDLKAFPAEQVALEDDLLHVRAAHGILLPQSGPDGAIRARVHFREGTAFPQLRIRRSGDATAKNTDYYELIIFARAGQASVKEFYLNRTLRGKGTRLGIVPLTEPLVRGAQIDIELSAVADYLQVLVNGKPAFGIHDAAIATGGYWGVAAGEAWFSNIQVRSLSAAKSTDPRLVQLEDAYAAARQREVAEPHLQNLKSLNSKYLSALERALEKASRAEQLDEAQALRAEKKRLDDGTALPPDDSTAGTSLKPLRQTYRGALSQLETQRETDLQSLRETFLQALDVYQAELTRAGNLDGALAVRARKELEASSANPAK